MANLGRLKRSVGYCTQEKCEAKSEGVFLLNHGSQFVCPRCRRTGRIIPETGRIIDNGPIFREVRVEFDYKDQDEKFHGLAIVKDTEVAEPASVYVLKSPLIRTEKRALKVAEGILSTLMRPLALAQGDIPSAKEYVISLDSDMQTLKCDLDELSRELSQGWLSRRDSSSEAAKPIRKEER